MFYNVVKWSSILGIGATAILWLMIWIAVEWERMVRPNDGLSAYGGYWLHTTLTLGGGALLGVLVGVLVECFPKKKA
ncbi:MAG: hypothetical protein AAF497_03860 [Planctomycetota bacterium]